MNKGFSLIELMVTVVILAILTTAGVNVFYRSIRGSSQVELRKTLDDHSRLILAAVGRFIREGKIVSLDGITKENCIGTGQTTGTSLVVSGFDNVSSTLSLNNGQISSVSGVQTIVLNSDSTYTLTQSGATPIFTWYCANGVPERIGILFTANLVDSQGEPTISKDYSEDVIIRNSGQ